MRTRHKWTSVRDTQPNGCRSQMCSVCAQLRKEQIEETITVSSHSGTYRKKKVWTYRHFDKWVTVKRVPNCPPAAGDLL